MDSLREAAEGMFSPSDAGLIVSQTLAGPADSLRRLYIAGCVILILSASLVPNRMAFTDRLASFSGFGDTAASSHASAGFFFDAAASLAVCFHCTVKLRQCPDPLEQHRVQSPRCFLQRLLHLLRDALDDYQTDARKFQRALAKLRRDLSSSDMLKFVESFGFSLGEVELAATRYFMQHEGRLPEKPGAVIEQINENRDKIDPALNTIRVSSILTGFLPIEL